MGIKRQKGDAPTRRFASILDNRNLTVKSPEKNLSKILRKNSGRNNTGKITARHDGGRQKRLFRTIDWRRDKREVEAKVKAIEYDPNRSANIALISFNDGEKRYILAPKDLVVGNTVTASDQADIKVGNALKLINVPIGTVVHNVEMTPGKGAQIVRSAGSGAIILSKEEKFVNLKMPSGEVRKIDKNCYATIGQLSNIDWKNIVLGKAGRKRHMGVRPKVRGTAQNPRTHPHGGGEGRSGEGMIPKTPWGKQARGLKTRKKQKYSNKYIVQRRKK